MPLSTYYIPGATGRIDAGGRFINPNSDGTYTALDAASEAALSQLGQLITPTLAQQLQNLMSRGGNPTYSMINAGSFGDSIANCALYSSGHDLAQVSGTSLSATTDRMATVLQVLSGGAVRVRFNGGVSGDNTAQMLARDAAGSSSTRRALTDASSLLCRHLIFSAGINDLQNPTLPAGASAATITAAVTASVANLVKLCQRAVAMGMIPHVPALLGYSYVPTSGLATNTLANVTTTQIAIQQWNALARATITAANGALGYFYDSFLPFVVDSTGAWLTGMHQGDGLHPCENSTFLIYAPVAQNIMWLEGMMGNPPFAYPAGLNLFGNADFSAASAGVATGINAYVGTGTGTLANQIVTWRGQQWQESVLTPTALDGNGNVSVQLDLIYATPTAGDVLGGEVQLYIDDGNGGAAPGVFQYLVRTRVNTTYADCPNSNPTISPKVDRIRPIDGRYVCNPIVTPATPSTVKMSVQVLTQQSEAPVRLRISRPRVVKLAATY